MGVAGTTGAGGAPPLCGVGTAECTDGRNLKVCLPDGTWGPPIFCPSACRKGVCTECVPGQVDCTTPGSFHVCNEDGIWTEVPPTDTRCTECQPGTTRCASHESVQTCSATGKWSSATPCEFVCDFDKCMQSPKRVFVTSMAFQGGALGGLAGADNICNKLAAAAKLPGSFRAWLSDAVQSPAVRFDRDGGPYLLVDVTIVANHWTTLTTKPLRHAIDVTELGGTPPLSTGGCVGPYVWSNTREDGTLSSSFSHCGGWSILNGSTVNMGQTNSLSSWSDACSATSSGAAATPLCSALAPLYCFEQ